MSAVAKSESLFHRDVRLYCQRKHQKTMGKSAREERQGRAILARQIRHIQKSKAYRERELDREQEKCLVGLVAIFDRQCQIATTRLARQLKEALGDKNLVDGLWGQHGHATCDSGRTADKLDGKHLGKRSSLKGNPLNSFGRQPRVLPREEITRLMTTPANRHRTSCSLPSKPAFAAERSRDWEQVRPDSPRPSPRLPPFSSPTLPSTLNQPYNFQESVVLPGTNRGSGKRPRDRSSRPRTADGISGSHYGAGNRWTELASPVRCPQHRPINAPTPPRTARSLRCLLHDVNREETAKTSALETPDDVCFRRQYLACVMSRKLPVSGLRSEKFVQQDDVRKKMEAKRKCMEEVRLECRERAKSAPAGLVRPFRNNSINYVQDAQPKKGLEEREQCSPNTL